MAFSVISHSFRHVPMNMRCCSKLVLKSSTTRLIPTIPITSNFDVQKREFHCSSLQTKWKLFKDNRLFIMNDINNTALKYGLFGVAIGNPSTWVVSLITWVNSLGLPWWGAIAGVALGFRAILLPFSVKASRQAMKMQEIQPELNELMERARISQSMGLASDAGRIRDEMMDIYKRAGVSPMAPMLGSLIQLPVIMSCFMGIRKLCDTSAAVQNGGTLWFMNLAAPDPTFTLPILAGLTTLFMTELGADGMNANGQIGMKYMMRGMSIFTIFVASKMSAGLCLYWITNATFAGIQTLCINPAARSTLKRWFTFSKKVEAIPPPPKPTMAMMKDKENAQAQAQTQAHAHAQAQAQTQTVAKEDVNKLVSDVKDSVFKEK